MLNTQDLPLWVVNSIESLALTYPSLTQLSVNSSPLPVLFRSDWPTVALSQIALITGGGAGHEPAHTQYIGKGMLTAAISGQIFASPSVQLIIDTIEAIVNKKGPGCLLIVKNYTGDRLNFGLACEMAKSKGIKCRMILVEDDCSLDKEKGVTGRRGVAGTVLVHKIAGALAERKDLNLDQLCDRLEYWLNKIRSIGVAFSSCTIPGREQENRIKQGFVELGLGIHNEPGVETLEYKSLPQIIEKMMQKLLSEYSFSGSENSNFIVLVNNLGSCTQMEMALIVRQLNLYFKENLKNEPMRIYSGSFMTSFDMKGFSFTLLQANQSELKEIFEYLDHSVNTPGWPNFQYSISPNRLFNYLKEIGEEKKSQTNTEINFLGKVLQNVAEKLISNEKQLNELDSHVGDGDCGSTLAQGALRILKEVSGYPLQNTADTIKELTNSIGNSMGGTSGVLYRIFFTALANNYNENAQKNVMICWKDALEKALESLLIYDNAREGHRTLLDALIPAIKSFVCSADKGEIDAKEKVKLAWEAAVKGSENTKNLKAGAGRSNYVPQEILAKYEDPGAKAIGLIFEGIYSSF